MDIRFANRLEKWLRKKSTSKRSYYPRSSRPLVLEQLEGRVVLSAIRSTPGFLANSLAANDDGSTPSVAIGFTVNFFGLQFDHLFVNNNGNVTFDSTLSTFTPFDLTSTHRQIIAPFFADVDTRGTGSGLAQYGTDTVNGHAAFAATWPLVGYFNSKTDKLDSFQVVLISRADIAAGDFDMEFNYDQIQWETGDASGGTDGLGGNSARAGFSNGTGAQGTFLELHGSAVPGSFLDSNPTGLIHGDSGSTVLGRYVFQARGNGIIMVQSTTTALVASSPAVRSGTPITFTATVSPQTSGTPTGTVTFLDGSATLGTGTLNQGTPDQATFTTSALSIGPHLITARYNGDPSFTASTSNCLLEVVTANAPAIWTGLGATTNWMNSQNWQGNQVPAFGDDLVFPASPPGSLSSSCDFTVGSPFNSLIIEDSYSLSGNGIKLSAGILVDSVRAPNATVSLPISLAAAQSFKVINSFCSSPPSPTSLTLSGPITGQQFAITFDVEPGMNGPASLICSGGIANAASLTKNGAGPLMLGGVNSYPGATQINAGTLQVAAENAVPSTSAVTVAAGASFNLTTFVDTIGSLAGNGAVSLGTATLTTGANNTTTTFMGTINGQGGVTKVGSGTFSLAGVNAYAGATTAAGGILILNGLPGNSQLILMGGTVENTAPITVTNTFSVPTNGSVILAMANLTFTGPGSLTGQLMIEANTATLVTLSGQLTGTGGLMKMGAGTLRLANSANNSSYSGSTSVMAGTLLVDDTQPSSGVAVHSGAFLSGIGTTGQLNVTGGTVSPGDTGMTSGVLTAMGDVTFDSASTFAVAHSADGTAASELTLSGIAHLNGVNLRGIASVGSPVSPLTSQSTLTILQASSLMGTAQQQEGDVFFAFGQAGKVRRIHYMAGSIVLPVDDSTHIAISSNDPSEIGQAVTLMATVTSDISTDGIPPGCVTFFQLNGMQATPIGAAVALNSSGVAVLSMPSVSSGMQFTAKFHDFDPATGMFITPTHMASIFANSLANIITQTVNRHATTTTVTSSANPTDIGLPVTLTVVVVSGAGTPTGMITLLDGASTLGTRTLSGGSATFMTSSLSVGVHSIVASYSGDTTFATSVGSLAQTIALGPRFGVAGILAHSEEHFVDFVSNLYVTLFRRAADVPGLWGWVMPLYHLQMTDEQVETAFLVSPEYVNRHGGFVLSTPSGPAPGSGWVTALYTDVLMRTPSSMEVQGWVNALQRGVSDVDVASVFVGGVEMEQQNIINAFMTFLGRQPTPAEIAAYLSAFQSPVSPPYTIEDLRSDFVASPEYFSRPSKGNGDNATWVGVAYQDILGRLPSTHEVNGVWVPILSGVLPSGTGMGGNGAMAGEAASRSGLNSPTGPLAAQQIPANLLDVANVFTHSQSHYIDFVFGLYQKYLRRTPDVDGLRGWVDGLFSNHLTDEQVSASFASAPEYVNNHGGFVNNLPGRGWVIALYNDVLGRTPSEAEIQGVLSALAAGQSPFAVAFGFTDSTEKQTEEITQAFMTLLGRTPSSAEVQQYLSAFQAGLTVEGLRTIFVGSAEYFFKPTKGNGNDATWVTSAFGEPDLFFRMPSVHEVNDIWVPILQQKQF
jgi:autotransporter-associated beta strand protein